MSRGLNPDAPKPYQPPKGNHSFTQLRPPLKRKQSLGKRMRKQEKSRRWMNIEFLLRSYATDLE
jgi:hypothetical protein